MHLVAVFFCLDCLGSPLLHLCHGNLRAVALVFIPKGGNTCILKKQGRKKRNCVVVMLNEF